MANEKKDISLDVLCQPIESKEQMKSVFREIGASGQKIKEFHFIGHSGMYGPMYGTVSYPEQFSPFELEKLQIPFARDAVANFHCCRTARWFAPYFATAQQVKTGGYHWYTAFSSRKDRFRIPLGRHKKLYCFGCPGKKSHGLVASFRKYFGLMKAEEMKYFSPKATKADDTYDSVSELYSETFKDIKVRKDEFQWLLSHIPQDPSKKVLDIGCGNGALLQELSTQIKKGIGVDVSGKLMELAKKNNAHLGNLSFEKLDGPLLPFEDNEFDLVISLLSFRYLDWDPIMLEIERVLKEDGKLLIVDMVTAPVKIGEWPSFIRGKISQYYSRLKRPEFHNNLRKLVTHPDWSTMLRYNPIRSQHEMKWYLESRFPGRKAEVINVGMHSRIIAFDTEDMRNTRNIELTYP